MVATFVDDGQRFVITDGGTKISLWYVHNVTMERRTLPRPDGSVIDVFFFLPSMMRVTIDRERCVVTFGEGSPLQFVTRFTLAGARALSDALKAKYEEGIRSRGRNIVGVRHVLGKSSLNPDVLAHIASFGTGKKGALATQEDSLKQNLGEHLAPRVARRTTRRKRRVRF